MLLRTIIAGLLLCGAACADEAQDPTIPETPDIADVATAPGEVRSAFICEPVETEGACALACDNDALIDQYVPEGVCMILECELVDGRTIPAGGCNL